MSDLTLILLAAGSSSRFELPVKKQWLRVGKAPLWQFVTSELEKTGYFSKIIITGHADEIAMMRQMSEMTIVEGGNSRQESLRNALQEVNSDYVLVSDIARACIEPSLLESIIACKEKADCIVPFLNVNDTVVLESVTIDRTQVKRIQTPQLSKTAVLKAALETEQAFTDESSAIAAYGGSRHFIEGRDSAHKLTHASDLLALPCIYGPSSATLVGNGFDVHAFEEGRVMMLGGVQIDVPYGFKAHSDGDVAIHALIDALLGAAGLGDIGMLFPDTDGSYKDIDSKRLLATTVERLERFGFVINNVDITIAAQAPRLADYKQLMRRTLAAILHLPLSRTNIKATTTEKLGFVGRKEGIAVMASATLNYYDWTRP